LPWRCSPSGWAGRSSGNAMSATAGHDRKKTVCSVCRARTPRTPNLQVQFMRDLPQAEFCRQAWTCETRIRLSAPYSFPVFTHHETISAAPVTAVRMTADRSNPSMVEISNQCRHMRTTLASITSVQKTKSQDTRSIWGLKAAAFTAARAFPKVMVLDLCNRTIISRFGDRINRPLGCQDAYLVPLRDTHSVYNHGRLSRLSGRGNAPAEPLPD
jgi:hypothetical protein